MSRVVVTGASGFVGRETCRRLAERGWKIRATARHPASIPAGAEVFATGDLSAFHAWGPLLVGVEAVVHLANAAHVKRGSEADIESARRLNVDTSVRLADAAAASGVKRLIYVSSAKVHGEETLAAAFSESSPFAPADPYAKLKAEAEAELQRASAKSGLELVIVRPPLVYGPGVRANFLALMRLLAFRLPLPFAAIENRRSLVYVGNLAEALCQCIAHPAAAGRTFLVSDGPALSTPALCTALGEALGRPAHLFRMDPRKLEWLPGLRKLTRSLVVEDSAIRRDLNWRAPFALAEGLRATAAWYLSRELRPGG